MFSVLMTSIMKSEPLLPSVRGGMSFSERSACGTSGTLEAGAGCAAALPVAESNEIAGPAAATPARNWRRLMRFDMLDFSFAQADRRSPADAPASIWLRNEIAYVRGTGERREWSKPGGLPPCYAQPLFRQAFLRRPAPHFRFSTPTG